MFKRYLSLVLFAALVHSGFAQTSDPIAADDLDKILAEFGQPKVASEAVFEKFEKKALYVPMRDGTRIAIDVILPAGLPDQTRIPAIMHMTRYWRAAEGQQPNFTDRFFVSRGYAMVNVDARGSGASFGTRPFELLPDEIRDYGEIAEWITQQSWSNGAVGAIGISYPGSTAELLAVTNHPAVKIVIPRFNELDVYTDIIYPGGILLEAFMGTWSNLVRNMDRNSMGGSVAAVDEDSERMLLQQAVREHFENADVYETVAKAPMHDDRTGGFTYDDVSPLGQREKIESSQVVISGWGSWMDAATADAVIKRFATFENRQISVIGPWSHGGGHHASPFLPATTQTTPSVPMQLQECLWLFDHFLKGKTNGAPTSNVLIYYTMGEEKWRATTTWPPAGSRMQRWYFAEGGRLSADKPQSDSGTDRYTVDFEATTGTSNRWHTQLGGGDVIYPDRALADRELLTYTGPPLAAAIEITGHPVVHISLSSTATDGALFVYLETVAPNGRVTYLTEGQLRLLHRKISAPAPHSLDLPYHSFAAADTASLVPGQTAEIALSLLPTSVRLEKGHRLRVAIAGHDKDTFARMPKTGTPVLTVQRNRNTASFIDLPVISR